VIVLAENGNEEEVNAMHNWGCYFRSSQFLAENHTGRLLTPAQINNARDTLINNGSVRRDTYVNTPENVITNAFGLLGIAANVEVGNANDYDARITCYQMGRNKHFTYEPAFDPDPVNTTRIRANGAVSYRYFRIRVPDPVTGELRRINR
jgi:hypothetical protein